MSHFLVIAKLVKKRNESLQSEFSKSAFLTEQVRKINEAVNTKNM